MKGKYFFEDKAVKIRTVIRVFGKGRFLHKQGEKIDRGTLANWEQGRTMPKISKLKKFLKKINMHPADFDATYKNFAIAVSVCTRNLEEQEKYTEEQVIQIIEEERNKGKENAMITQ